MVEIGSVVTAQVFRIETYGIYLKYGDETVVVLAPEMSWTAEGDIRGRVHIGDVYEVSVLRYVYKTREILGSIRRVHRTANPYWQLSRLEPGAILRGTVQAVVDRGLTVRLENGARGHLAASELADQSFRNGDEIEVTIAGLEVDEGTLTLELAQKGAEPAERLVTGSLNATPV